MVSRLVAIVALAALLVGLPITPAFADAVVPGGGSAFGEHVSGMAPEHPKMDGFGFGTCVSTMAQTGTCPDHH